MIKDYLIISGEGSREDRRFDIDKSAPTYLSVFRMRFRPVKKSRVSLKTPCPLQVLQSPNSKQTPNFSAYILARRRNFT